MTTPEGTAQRKVGWKPPTPKQPPQEPARGRWMRTITKRPVDWLWKPFLQRKAINLITGDPKTGKSTMVCEIAAAFSTGRPLPGETIGRPPMRVWLLNGEDYADDTIVWRLENQGADPDRILITDIGEQLTEEDVGEIVQEIKDKQIDVAIIDPLQSWMGPGIDMNKANETRPWFGLFREAALATGCTFIFVRHRRKGSPEEGGNLQAGLGSIDISGMARSELSTVKKDDKFTLYRLGGNVGSTGGGWEYHIKVEVPENGDHGVLRWNGERRMATGNGSAVPKKGAAAINWLKEFLGTDRKAADDTVTAGIKAGFTLPTIHRARKLIADTEREGLKHYWRLKSALLPEHQIVGKVKES